MDRSSFVESCKVKARVIFALLMREVLTRYGRHNIGVLWMFVEPMIFTLGVSALWSLTRAFHGSDLPIVAFAITGYSAVLLWRNMPTRVIDAIEPNRTLLYHRNVRVGDIFAARLLLEAAGASISFVVLSLFFIAAGWMKPPEDILLMVWAWLLLAWFGSALAVLLAAFNSEYKSVEKFWHPFSYIMFPLSGAAFLVSALPTDLQKFVLLIPMVHGAEALREGYFGGSVKAIYDLEYLFLANMVVTLLGLAKLREISPKVAAE